MRFSSAGDANRVAWWMVWSPILFLFFLLLISNEYSLGQTLLHNPITPRRNDAGRTITLKEVLRIKEDGKKMLFNVPKHLALTAEGDLIFFDYSGGPHLYKLSQDGRFLFDALNRGQGPKECLYVSDYLIDNNKITVLASSPPKVIDYDLSGRFLQERKTGNSKGLYFLHSIEGKIYAIRDEIPYTDAIFKRGIVDSYFRLYEISTDFRRWRRVFDFPVKHNIQGSHWERLVQFVVANDGHRLFVVNSDKYRILAFDPVNGRIDKLFDREYARQTIERSNDAEKSKVPNNAVSSHPDYYFDIINLHVVQDKIWVITSTTKDKGTKRLVDVFDKEGNYVDCFFLAFPPNNQDHYYTDWLITNDGFIYAPEQDVEGYVSIGKYRIIYSSPPKRD